MIKDKTSNKSVSYWDFATTDDFQKLEIPDTIKESEISIESNNNNLQDWGSVQNLFISSDIEKEFDVELTTDEIANFNSVLEIENILKKYIKIN